jgi:Leucine-rich repeat (LRR) protein
MSESALRLIRQAKAEGWRRLDLGNTSLRGTVPAAIGELDALEELILSDEWEEGAGEEAETHWTDNEGKLNLIATLPPVLPPRLRMLVAGRNDLADIRPLAALRELEVLDLHWTEVADLSPLAGLTRLQHLNLRGCKAVDLAPLAGLHGLRHLDLRATAVVDIAALADLKELEALFLGGTRVADVQALAGLTRLRTLDLGQTRVRSVAPLAGLRELAWLSVWRTGVGDGLEGHPAPSTWGESR